MTQFIVTAQFEDRDGAAARGRVVFDAIVERALDGTVIALGDKVTAWLDATGAISQELVVDANGYTFTARIKGAPKWQGEIPGVADIDLLAVPTAPPTPPGPFLEIPDTIYAITAANAGGSTTAMTADDDIVISFDGLLELNASGNIIAAGLGQIRCAETGACTLRYARSDLVDAFRTAVPGSAITFVQAPRNEVWLIGDMEIPE